MGTNSRLWVKQKRAGEVWQPPTHRASRRKVAEPLHSDNSTPPPPQPPSPPSPPPLLSQGWLQNPPESKKNLRWQPIRVPPPGSRAAPGSSVPSSTLPACRSPSPKPRAPNSHKSPPGEPQNCSFQAAQPVVAKATAPSPRELSPSNSQAKNPPSRTSPGDESPQNRGEPPQNGSNPQK